MNYSIHTLEMHAKISFEDFWLLYKNLKQYSPAIEKEATNSSKNSLTPSSTSFVFRRLPFKGITRIVLQRTDLKHITLQCNIYIVINPYNIYHQCTHSDHHIIEIENIAICFNILNELLQSIIPERIANSLQIHRLDFCVDLRLQTKKMAEEYIRLLRKGIPTKRLKEHTSWNDIQRRHVPYPDSLLLECCSYSFQIYPKYSQLKQKGYVDPIPALGIVRFELRANSDKIRLLEKKYSCQIKDNPDNLPALIPEISKSEIKKTIMSMVGSDEFRTYEYMKEKINNSSFSLHRKQQLLEYANYLSHHKYSFDFLKNFDLKHKDWKRIINDFHTLGCSPIPVPRTFSSDIYPGVIDWDA